MPTKTKPQEKPLAHALAALQAERLKCQRLETLLCLAFYHRLPTGELVADHLREEAPGLWRNVHRALDTGLVA